MSKTAEATPRTSDAEAQQQKIQSEHVDRAEDIHVDGEQGKFSAILGILRKLVGVADVVDLRLSLPSQLLDPIPNLEYWNYMESPKHFVAIPEPDDEVERMLAVLAWWFSKMLKHTGKVHKPFNSILGERFFCHWDVNGSSSSSNGSSSSSQRGSESTASSSTANVSAGAEVTSRVEYITEQVSHHPPVSAFVYRCQERGIEAVGMDHIKAKFTGLSATVATGSECKGIFVTLKSRGNEMYKCTHPTGSIVGWLRGSLKVQMIETSYIVCAKTGLAAVVEFKEERWFSKDKGNVAGKVFRYDESKYGDQIASWRLKDIPKACSVVATFGGNWDQQVTVKHNGSERTLIDMAALKIADKVVKPLEQQGELESRRVWEPVASKMRQGKYAEASRTKKAIEEAQRTLAAERKERGEEFVPALFKPDYADSGMPELLDDAPINM